MSDQQLAVISGNQELSVDQMRNHVALIDQMTKAVMKANMHYGAIPGCGDKPTLLQPGAQKLALTFQLAADPEVEINDLDNGHREYHVRCNLNSRITGQRIGTGLGNCNTMESRYRYRTQNTGVAVPQDYWDHRDPIILGGPQYSPRKVDGKWMIFEKIEHDNPADYYNTCEKMAKKRAFVDAILTATAASDHFTQDIEDNPELYGGASPANVSNTNQSQPANDAAPADSDPVIPSGKNAGKKYSELNDKQLNWYANECKNQEMAKNAKAEIEKRLKGNDDAGMDQRADDEIGRDKADESDIRRLHAACEKEQVTIAELLEMYELESTEKIRKMDIDPMIKWLADPSQKPVLNPF